jgi:phosphopantothenoylcysteine decarboxylase / phosphopantothenate---cysteine ligase
MLPRVVQGRILLGVTGGIAAYKVVEVARDLTQAGADVRVVMTESATRFVGPQTFAGVTGNRVHHELFGEGPDAPHVELARGADLAVVAPATANVLAKMARGIADDLLSSTLLMVRCPILVAPAMHTEMWEHPATQENLASLSERGVDFVGPATGPLMSGDEGIGRMAEPAEILAAIERVLGRSHDLTGRRVVVTAGGTQEPIDPVRFIGNRSSGLMGAAVAEAAAARGAKVTLVAGPQAAQPGRSIDVVEVATADEMRAAVLELAPDADVVVKAAAVADFKPAGPAERKLKKADGVPRVEMVPTPDILAELGSDPGLRKPGAVLVGFAAETETDPGRLAQIAEGKRKNKGADLIVANDVSSSDSGFGTRTNRAVIAGPGGTRDVGLVTKKDLAGALMDEVVALLGSPDH